jgi:nucleotide-binding universal stress UspA family protein
LLFMPAEAMKNMTTKNILVAVDFGATSLRAFDQALVLAQRLALPLDIVTVCPPVPPFVEDPEGPPYIAAARDELAKLAAIAIAHGVKAETHLRSETVVFGLLEAIEDLDPQFVVVGSHGRRGIQRALLGSVSESLARRAHVPVLIVPAPERQEVAAATAWACEACGHILDASERKDGCARCGAAPARWIAAPIDHEPADAGEPAVGEGAANAGAAPDPRDGPSLFATAPAGAYDRSQANAEIRVRRY